MIVIEKYRLRKLIENDKFNLVKYANNYNIWLNLTDSFPYPYTLHDAEKFIEFCKDQTKELNLCIDFNGELIGMIGVVFNNGIKQKTVDFGYWLAQPFWGQGIMTKCASEFIKFVFSNYDIIRIQSLVFDWNKPSIRVLEKLGFVYEGKSEKAIFKDNKITDEHRFALIKPDL